MIYKNCKIYGPYKRKDGRMHVVVQWPSKSLQTVSYPKYYMELKLGRYLKVNEHVHHKDNDASNNNPDNFELRDRTEHLSEHATVHHIKEEICFWCEKNFTMSQKHAISRAANRSKNNVGPFCSRRCSGLYAKSQQT